MAKTEYVIAGLLGLFFTANGVFMLIAPQDWYWAVDGVADSGPFNQHFIRDIGFIYFLSGGAMAAGLVRPAQRLGMWLMVTGWQVLHALFHVWEVIVGICGPEALWRDFLGVSLPALLLIWLLLRLRRADEPGHSGAVVEDRG